MRRTQDEILQESIAEKELQLPELDSNSITSVWLLWLNVTSFVIHVFEQIFYAEQAKLEAAVELKRYGSISWYRTEVLKFQLGDELAWDDKLGLYYYEQIDESKQIIEQCSVNEQKDGSLLIKIAKKDNGVLAPLDPAAEMPLAYSYINDVAVGGTELFILSQPADIINGMAEIAFDGNLSIDEIKSNLKSAMDGYRDSSEFNGVFLVNDLIEFIRDADGIDDVYFDVLTATSIDGVETIRRSYQAQSGYFNYTENLIDTWTYTPRHQNNALV